MATRHSQCTTCQHAARAAIEDAVVDAGGNVSAAVQALTAKGIVVERRALARHLDRGHIVAEMEQESTHRAKLGVGRCWRRLAQHATQVMAAIEAAATAGEYAALASLLREHRKLVELEMRVHGILKAPSVQVDATIGLADVQVGSAVGEIIERLAPQFPGIEAAVLRLLPPEPSVES